MNQTARKPTVTGQPITRMEYQKFTEEEWKGTRVKVVSPLVCGSLELTVGATAIIERKFLGFALRSDPCECCKVKVRISKCPLFALQVIE